MMEAALLAAVLADPDDDLPRLALADWWEKNGQSERAEFVRVQCRIAELEPQTKRYPAYIGPEVVTVPPGLPPLRAREDELLAAQVGPPGRLNDGSWSWPLWQWLSYWRWRRGFVVAVGCTAESWLEHGDAISAPVPLPADVRGFQPVEEVTLTTWPRLTISGAEGCTHYRLGGHVAVVTPEAGPAEHAGVTEQLLRLRWPRVRHWHMPPNTPRQAFVEATQQIIRDTGDIVRPNVPRTS